MLFRPVTSYILICKTSIQTQT